MAGLLSCAGVAGVCDRSCHGRDHRLCDSGVDWITMMNTTPRDVAASRRNSL